jgi:PAS domain S-box-containing protein
MTRKPIPDDGTALRAAAEAKHALESPGPQASAPGSSALLHELRVHQIELEMQNEELRRDRLELQEAHDRIVDLYDFAPVGYLTLDLRGFITAANLTGATLLGVERKQLLGRPFAAHLVDAEGDRWHLFFGALTHRNHPHDNLGDFAVERPDGTVFTAHLVCNLQATGKDLGPEVRMVLTDVTESGRLEQALRETKTRLSLVIDSTDDGYSDWDVLSGRVTYSRRFAAMLGHDLGDLDRSVSTWERLVHPDDRQKAWDAAQAHLRGETERFENEERLRHKDGRWLWTLHRGKVVERDASGKPLRMVGMHSDITSRKSAAEALRASHHEQGRLVAELRSALRDVKTLSGLLPICMYCKKIRDEKGYWDRVEHYISSHTDALFSHGMCEECYEKHKDD